MAYASNYTLHQAPNGTYNADFNRYHVMAELHNMPGYSVQRYTYPDTLADKGFLLDIDNADNGVQNEDMNVVFVDKNTIRAYKRSTQPQSNVPDLYYVAHFHTLLASGMYGARWLDWLTDNVNIVAKLLLCLTLKLANRLL